MTITAHPTEHEAFQCQAPECGVLNPPVPITHNGERVCFQCGHAVGVVLKSSTTNPLTRADRCDACPAQAYSRATLRVGEPLLFCAHHLRKNHSALLKVSAIIEDFTEALAKEEAGGLTAV